MYTPKQYEITDSNVIHEFIQENAFGELISVDNGIPVVTHMPFLLNTDSTVLTAHIARQNPHWKILDNQSVLVVLNGPHDYISPSWYSTPNVPTWNYQTVHITGECQIFSDEMLLRDTVNELSQKYESQFEEPWQPEYNLTMLKAIVGLEIKIETIECKFKLNQKQSLADRIEVAKQLDQAGNHQLADAMRQSLDNSE